MKRQNLMTALLSALLIAVLLCGCGATAKPMDAGAPMEFFTTGSATQAAPEAPMPEAEYGYANAMGSTADSAQVTLGSQVSEPLTDVRDKIIYSANVEMETMEFTKTLDALDSAIVNIGGFTENAEVHGNTAYETDGSVRILNRRAYYTIRVPADRLDEFLSQTNGLGNVTSSGKSARNVTSQYTDFEARRTSLETQEARLLELIAEADSIDALITLESKLSEVRYEIESIQRNLNDLDNQIAYSTVNINIREVEVYRQNEGTRRTFWQRMGDAFTAGARRFGRGLQNFLVGLSGSVFTLLLVAAIVVVACLLVRRYVKKCRAKKQKKEPEE